MIVLITVHLRCVNLDVEKWGAPKMMYIPKMARDE
jgi:hypothetical protein